MKYEATTIKDIAKALNVSTSTVSRALQNHYAISAKTKKLVLDYAEKIQYSPNPAALSLRERKTLTIGIIVCEIANSFFSQVINGVESLASERGYNVIISQTHESYNGEVDSINFLSSRSIDGLLVSISAETDNINHITKLHKLGLPIVFFDRILPELKTHSVTVDNFKGAYDATTHLLRNGYKKIAAITSSDLLSISKERLSGYKQALKDNGIEPDNKWIKSCFYGGMKMFELENVMDELLGQQDKPDAIFAASDKLTTGCLNYLNRHKIAIPEELALVGFSNSDLAHLLAPPITTIRQPAFEMGKTAGELLLQLIKSKRPVTDFERRIFVPELIIRESSAKKRKKK